MTIHALPIVSHLAVDLASGPDVQVYATRDAAGTYTRRSPLFAAALQLLASEPDPLARLCLLRDAFPKASLEAIQQTLKETAILFAHAGVRT